MLQQGKQTHITPPNTLYRDVVKYDNNQMNILDMLYLTNCVTPKAIKEGKTRTALVFCFRS